MYRLIAKVKVNDGVSLDANKVALLEVGTLIQVLEALPCDEIRRVRARIAEPPGWISLLDTAKGARFAEKVLRRGGLPAQLSDAGASASSLSDELWEQRQRRQSRTGSSSGSTSARRSIGGGGAGPGVRTTQQAGLPTDLRSLGKLLSGGGLPTDLRSLGKLRK